MFREDRQTDIVCHLLNDVLPDGGYLAMLKVYMDLGAKRQSGRIMCATAALFEPWYYDAFLHEWQSILDGWNATAFHATDFYPGGKGKTGDFRRKRPDGTLDPEKVARQTRDATRVVEVIAATVRQLFIVTLREDEYEAIAPKAWRDQFGDVRRVAVQLLADHIGHWANDQKYRGEIAYFYETGPKDEARAYQALHDRFDDPRHRKHMRMASTPIGVGKGKAHGLEVADCVAWHWTKWKVESHDTRQRKARADIFALMDLLKAKGRKIDVRLFTGEALQTFLVRQGCRRRKGAKPSARNLARAY